MKTQARLWIFFLILVSLIYAKLFLLDEQKATQLRKLFSTDRPKDFSSLARYCFENDPNSPSDCAHSIFLRQQLLGADLKSRSLEEGLLWIQKSCAGSSYPFSWTCSYFGDESR